MKKTLTVILLFIYSLCGAQAYKKCTVYTTDGNDTIRRKVMYYNAFGKIISEVDSQKNIPDFSTIYYYYTNDTTITKTISVSENMEAPSKEGKDTLLVYYFYNSNNSLNEKKSISYRNQLDEYFINDFKSWGDTVITKYKYSISGNLIEKQRWIKSSLDKPFSPGVGFENLPNRVVFNYDSSNTLICSQYYHVASFAVDYSKFSYLPDTSLLTTQYFTHDVNSYTMYAKYENDNCDTMVFSKMRNSKRKLIFEYLPNTYNNEFDDYYYNIIKRFYDYYPDQRISKEYLISANKERTIEEISIYTYE